MRLASALALLLAAGCAAPRVAAPPAAPPTSAAPATPAASAARAFPFETVVRDLPNGLRVVVVPTGLPEVVSLQLVVGVGSRDEVEPGRSGFAHFFEHMMFRGTEAVPAADYQRILSQAGADQNAYTTDDRTVYHTTFLRGALPEMMRIEGDRFQNLAYAEDAFRTEARAVLGEYNKNFANPVQRLLEAQREAAFTTHTYRHTTMGFLADIQQMPEGYDYAQDFFRRHYRPENTTLLVAGDVAADEVMALAEQHFGAWAPGYVAPEIPAEPPPAGPLARHVAWDGPTPPWVTVAFRAPAAYSDDEAEARDAQALSVLATLAFGPSSSLYRQLVVEEQTVDQLFASLPDRRDPTLMTVGARVKRAEDVAAVRDAIQRELALWRVAAPDAARLDAFKNRTRYGFAAGLDHSKSIADALVPSLAVGRDPARIERQFARLMALTPDDVQRAADRTFRDSAMVVVTLAQGGLPDEALAAGSVDMQVALVDLPHVDDRPAAPAPPVPAAAWQNAPASVQSVRFETVRLPGTSPLVSLRFSFATGAADDPEGQEGLAALTARMLADAGSRDLTYAQIQDALFPLAAGLGVQVDKERTTFAATVHADNLDRWWAVAGGMLLDPGFRADDFERVRADLVSEIRTGLRAGNDEELGKEVLYETIYGPDHPYGHLSLGHAAAVERLTLADVQAFYRAHVTQDRLTLGVGGGVDDERLRAIQRHLAANLPEAGAARPAIPAPPAPTAPTVLVVHKPETRAAAISMGFPIAVTRQHPDFVALDLVRSWLGEHRNSSARLFQRLREVRGMNYGNYAYTEYFPDGMYQFMPDPGLVRQQQIFQIWIRPVPPEQAHFAIRAGAWELDRLVRDGLTEADFERTRAFLRNYAALLTATQSRRVGYALDQQAYGLPEFVAWYREALDRLTLDDVNRAIRAHLSGPLQIVVVTPDASLADALASGRESPITYASPVPDDVAAEDALIQRFPLGLSPSTVRTVPVGEVFE